MTPVPGKSYPFTLKPTVRGDYNYWGYGWASAAPCYAAFDGTDWVDGPIFSTENFWIMTDRPEPFGHYNPAVGEDPPLKTDLKSRLARHKFDKQVKELMETCPTHLVFEGGPYPSHLYEFSLDEAYRSWLRGCHTTMRVAEPGEAEL